MGSYSGAELCELIGLYMLNQLREVDICPILYRDDGLLCLNKPAKAVHKIGLKIIDIFKKNGLSITTNVNKRVVNFLDLTLDLNSASYYIYVKEGHIPLYVHKLSNHPQNVIENIPKGVEKRLSNLSMTEELFLQKKEFFEECLRKSGYHYTLRYNPDTDFGGEKVIRNRKRKRNITYFNPPWDSSVQTNIGKAFLKLVTEKFPKQT